MQLTLEACRALAIQYGLSLQFVIKEFHVFDVLAQITSLTSNEKKFVFKGGTALNKVYLKKNQRFSEDLDFDLECRNFQQLRSFAEKLAGRITGYKITEFRRVKDTMQFYCKFKSPLQYTDHIRVDIAIKPVITSKPPERLPANSQYTQLMVSGFKVYSIDDLVARKMSALRNRTEGKDIYDVYHALPLCKNIRPALQKMLLSEGLKETPGHFLEKTLKSLQKADPKKLQIQTNPFIPLTSRPPNWKLLKQELENRLEQLTEQP